MKNYISRGTLFLLFFAFGCFQPAADASTVEANGSLIGSVWTAEFQSQEQHLTYKLRFNQNNVAFESTCHVEEISSTLKSELDATYTEADSVAELKVGLVSTIPAGHGTCSINFPAGLQFQLVNHDQIYLQLNGVRRPTQMKRLKQ